MSNFETLTKGVENSKNLEDYFLDFFKLSNLKNYEIPKDLNKDEVNAIKHLFKSKKEIKVRIEEAFSYDPFCLEAFFAYMMLTEDLFLYYRFESYYSHFNEYGDFTDRQKKAFIVILEYYIDFLIDISNITKAIKVVKTIVKITGNKDDKYVSTLASLYHYNENLDDFYRLYQYNDFTIKEYLLLILTLLKYEDNIRATQVLQELFDKYKETTYLDHLWDVDETVPEQKNLVDIVEEIYDDLSAVPDFFSWVSKAKKNCRVIEE